MLSKEAAEALEQYRNGLGENLIVLANELLFLYPLGWNDPVTVDNLLKCGFVNNGYCYCIGGKTLWFTVEKGENIVWRVQGAFIKREFRPNNMRDVWKLMQRCKLPNPLDRHVP